MKTLLVYLLLSFPIVAKWEDWSIENRNLFKLYVVGSSLDYMQTKEVLKSPYYKEGNPIFGSNPSSERLILQKILGAGVIYFSADRIKSTRGRRKELLTANAIQWGVVIHNEHVGATFLYSW
jgi:hypothetical protein